MINGPVGNIPHVYDKVSNIKGPALHALEYLCSTEGRNAYSLPGPQPGNSYYIDSDNYRFCSQAHCIVMDRVSRQLTAAPADPGLELPAPQLTPLSL